MHNIVLCIATLGFYVLYKIHASHKIYYSERNEVPTQDHGIVVSGHILCVASKRLLLLATTIPALSLSSTMKTVLYFLENLHWLDYYSFVGLDLSHEVNFHCD